MPRSTDRLQKQPWHRLYSTQRWRKLARLQLDAEPLCVECKRMGVITKADVADHVAPHRGDERAFWGGALQSLCNTCHLRKIGIESNERRTGRSCRPKRSGCTPDGMPRDPSHNWHTEPDW